MLGEERRVGCSLERRCDPHHLAAGVHLLVVGRLAGMESGRARCLGLISHALGELVSREGVAVLVLQDSDACR